MSNDSTSDSIQPFDLDAELGALLGPSNTRISPAGIQPFDLDAELASIGAEPIIPADNPEAIGSSFIASLQDLGEDIVTTGQEFAAGSIAQTVNQLTQALSFGLIEEPVDVEAFGGSEYTGDGGYIPEQAELEQAAGSLAAGLAATGTGAAIGAGAGAVFGGVGAAPGAVAGAALGRGYYSIGQGVLQGKETYSSVRRDLEADGHFGYYDRAQAYLAAIGTGAGVTALEMVSLKGVGGLFSSAAKTSAKEAQKEVGKALVRKGRVRAILNAQAAKTTAKGFGIEATEELTQSALDQAVQSIATGKDKFDAEALSRAAIAGGFAGGVAGAGAGGYQSVRTKQSQRQTTEHIAETEAITQQYADETLDTSTEDAVTETDSKTASQRAQETQLFTDIQKAANPDTATEAVIPKEQASPVLIEEAFADDPDLTFRTNEDGDSVLANKQQRLDTAITELAEAQNKLDGYPDVTKLEKRRHHKQQEIARLEEKFDALVKENKIDEADQVTKRVDRAEQQLEQLDEKINALDSAEVKTERGKLKDEISLLDDEIEGLEAFIADPVLPEKVPTTAKERAEISKKTKAILASNDRKEKTLKTNLTKAIKKRAALEQDFTRLIEQGDLQGAEIAGKQIDTIDKKVDSIANKLALQQAEIPVVEAPGTPGITEETTSAFKRHKKRKEYLHNSLKENNRHLEELKKDFDTLVAGGNTAAADLLVPHITRTENNVAAAKAKLQKIKTREHKARQLADRFSIKETEDNQYALTEEDKLIGTYDTRQDAVNALMSEHAKTGIKQTVETRPSLETQYTNIAEKNARIGNTTDVTVENDIVIEDQNITPEQLRHNTDSKRSILHIGLSPEAVEKATKRSISWAKAWGQATWTTHRGLTPEVHFKYRKSQGLQKKHKFEATNLLNRLEKQIRKTSNYNTDTLELLNRITTGELRIEDSTEFSALPDDVKTTIQHMRDLQDRLTWLLVDYGVVDGELALRLEENIGAYLNRSYKGFDFKEQELHAFIDEQLDNKRLVDKAMGLFRKQNPELKNKPDKEVVYEIRKFLVDTLDTGSPLKALEKMSTYRKNTGILSPRKDIPAVIRELWGERTTITENFARSIAKSANLLSTHKFLTEFRKIGLRDGLFSTDRSNRNIVSLVSDENKALDVLAGLYTTPEFKYVVEKFMDPRAYDVPSWIKFFAGLNVPMKLALTAYSVQTQGTNIVGNIPLMMLSGNIHRGLLELDKTFKATMVELNIDKESGAFRDFYLECLEQNVVDSNVTLREMEENYKDLIESTARIRSITDVLANKFWEKTPQKVKDLYSQASESPITQAALSTIKFPLKAYAAGDNFFKMMDYSVEKERAREVNPDLSEQEIRDIASKNTAENLPYYDYASAGVQQLRRNFITGPFMILPAEIIRVLATKTTKAYTAIRNGDKNGYKQLALLALGVGAIRLTGELSRLATGVNEDEEEHLRALAYIFDKNSELLYTGIDQENNLRYVTLSNNDPFFVFTRPFTAVFFRPDLTVEEKIIGAVKEFTAPFVSPELLPQRLLDIKENRIHSGSKVKLYDENNLTDMVTSSIAHILKGYIPSTVAQAKRAAKDIHERRAIDAAVGFFGLRPRNVPLDSIVPYTGIDFNKTRQGITSRFNSTIKKALRNKSLTDKELTVQLDLAQKSLDSALHKMHKSLRAVEYFALKDKDTIKNELRSARVKESLRDAVLYNRKHPYQVSQQSLAAFEQLGLTDKHKKIILRYGE